MNDTCTEHEGMIMIKVCAQNCPKLKSEKLLEKYTCLFLEQQQLCALAA